MNLSYPLQIPSKLSGHHHILWQQFYRLNMHVSKKYHFCTSPVDVTFYGLPSHRLSDTTVWWCWVNAFVTAVATCSGSGRSSSSSIGNEMVSCGTPLAKMFSGYPRYYFLEPTLQNCCEIVSPVLIPASWLKKKKVPWSNQKLLRSPAKPARIYF